MYFKQHKYKKVIAESLWMQETFFRERIDKIVAYNRYFLVQGLDKGKFLFLTKIIGFERTLSEELAKVYLTIYSVEDE